MKLSRKMRPNKRIMAGIIAGLLIVTMLLGLVAPFIANIQAEEVGQCLLINY